jgi:pimeloyl-ACP methyl ester carboxylesterase
MANPIKSIKLTIVCLLFGVFLLPASIVFSQALPAQAPPPPATRSRLNELALALQAKPPAGPGYDEWCNAQLYLRKARFLLSAFAPSDDLEYPVSRELRQAEESLARIRSGRPAPWAGGMREEGYYCDNDGSFQPFLSYVPASARPGKKRPLLVYLHGYNPDWNLVNWQGLPLELTAYAEAEGCLMASPFGRANTDYQGIGEQDVLTVIAEMVKRYPVDEDRIILVGYSMGGTGAWTLGAHYPDLFAGLLIVSGRGDYYTWHKVARQDLPAYKQRLIDTEFAGSLVQNLQTIPIFSAHGEKDDLVPVEEARYIANAVKKVNPGLIYIEVPGGSHFICDQVLNTPACHDWLRQCRRGPAPAGYTSLHPRYNRPSGTNAGARAHGPVKEAFLSPFVFVLAGNPGDPRQCVLFKQAVADYYRFSKALPRVAAEANLTPDQLAARNLFLFGEPETSALIRAVLKDSPVTVTADSYVVGRKSYPRKGNGLYLVRRSPWNPDKLAVVQCGIRWGEALPENHKFEWLPDYIVYTAASDDDGSNTALSAGFFNDLGQLED